MSSVAPRFRCCRPVLPPLAVAGTFTLYATPCMVEQISSGCLRRWFKSKKTTTHGKICVALLNIKPPRHQSVLRRLPFVQCRHLGLPRAVKARLPRAVKAIALRPRAKKQRHHQQNLILSYSHILKLYILTEKVDRGSSRGGPSSSKRGPM